MKPTNSVYTGLPTTVFEEMSRLAIANSAINLGQGFPDVDGPLEIREKAAQAAISGPNQSPPRLGKAVKPLPACRNGLGKRGNAEHGP